MVSLYKGLSCEKAKLDMLIEQNNYELQSEIIMKQSKKVDQMVNVCQRLMSSRIKRYL